MRWVERYEEQSIKRHNKIPISYKVKKEHVRFILNEIKEFYEKIKKYNIDVIICIDETNINALQKRHHCYNDIGKRCIIKHIHKKYSKNIQEYLQ